MKRRLRRMAFIEFPLLSYSEQTIATIAAEGYDEVGIALIPDDGNLGNVVNQGYTLAQGRQLQDWCQKHKLSVTLFTGYMKYEEPLLAREPQRAMITFGGAGERLDSDGVRSHWLCPFRPENIDRYYTQMLEPVTHWPVLRELHLNDEAFLGFPSGAIGCYCDVCTERYRQQSGQRPPTHADWDSPDWWRWIDYRFAEWTTLHANLRERIKQARPDVVVGIQHSPIAPLFAWNPWKTAIDLGRDARALDLLATDPYHYMHLDVVTLRPHRRLLTEGTRGLAGACLHDRLMTIYPQGFMPPAQSTPMGRQDGLLAGIVPFALGADTVGPYTHEMMKIIPGFSEAWDECRKLMPYFEQTRPAPFVTVIAPVQSEIYGHPRSDWGASHMVGLMDLLYRCGLPWRWLWDSRIEDVGDALRGPILVANAHCLTRAQLDVIEAAAARGEGVVWIGQVPEGQWSGGYLPAKEVERGEFEIETGSTSSDLFDHLSGPVVLASKTDPPAQWTDAAQMIGQELWLLDCAQSRQAWLAGFPKFDCMMKNAHGSVLRATGGTELLRRLLLWASNRKPAACLAPFPPVNDYAHIRPWDRRGVHNAELFPLVGETGILAILFPYTPVGFETTVVFHHAGKKIARVRELWRDEDFTDRLIDGDRIPFRFDGGRDLMAFWAEFE